MQHGKAEIEAGLGSCSPPHWLETLSLQRSRIIVSIHLWTCLSSFKDEQLTEHCTSLAEHWRRLPRIKPMLEVSIATYSPAHQSMSDRQHCEIFWFQDVEH